VYGGILNVGLVTIAGGCAGLEEFGLAEVLIWVLAPMEKVELQSEYLKVVNPANKCMRQVTVGGR